MIWSLAQAHVTAVKHSRGRDEDNFVFGRVLVSTRIVQGLTEVRLRAIVLQAMPLIGPKSSIGAVPPGPIVALTARGCAVSHGGHLYLHLYLSLHVFETCPECGVIEYVGV